MNYVWYLAIGIILLYIFYKKDKNKKSISGKIGDEIMSSMKTITSSHIMLTTLRIKLKLDQILKDYHNTKSL